jgi:hypothetical protein
VCPGKPLSEPGRCPGRPQVSIARSPLAPKGSAMFVGRGRGGEGFPSWGKRSHAVRILTALHECSGWKEPCHVPADSDTYHTPVHRRVGPLPSEVRSAPAGSGAEAAAQGIRSAGEIGLRGASASCLHRIRDAMIELIKCEELMFFF